MKNFRCNFAFIIYLYLKLGYLAFHLSYAVIFSFLNLYRKEEGILYARIAVSGQKLMMDS